MPDIDTFQTTLSLGNPDVLTEAPTLVAYLQRVDMLSTSTRGPSDTLQQDAWARRASAGTLSLRIDAEGRTVHGQKTLLRASMTGKLYPVSLQFQDNTTLSGMFWIAQFQDSLNADGAPSPFRLRLISEGVVVFGA